MDRRDPLIRATGGKDLFLVELSRTGVGSLRPRPPAGSCLGESRFARLRLRPWHSQRGARLATAVGPCARHGQCVCVTGAAASFWIWLLASASLETLASPERS